MRQLPSPPPSLSVVPLLDDVANNPAALPLHTVLALLARCHLVESVLVSRLLVLTNEPLAPGQELSEPDKLLTPKETAAQMGVSVPWLHGHWKRLPFARKLSYRVLRFSEQGLRQWLATRSR